MCVKVFFCGFRIEECFTSRPFSRYFLNFQGVLVRNPLSVLAQVAESSELTKLAEELSPTGAARGEDLNFRAFLGLSDVYSVTVFRNSRYFVRRVQGI